MMPKKLPAEKRTQLIGVKVNDDTKIKINYLAGAKGEMAGTYIYNLLLKHLEEKEPYISREIASLTEEEKNALLKSPKIKRKEGNK